MSDNEIIVPGAEEVNLYLRNYSYADMLTDLPIISLGLANDLSRLVYNTGSAILKIMVDASGSSNHPDNLVMVTGSGGAADVSDITSTELNTLSGIESNIQNQLNERIENYALSFYNGTILEDYIVSRSVVGTDVIISLSPRSGTSLHPVFNAEFITIPFTSPFNVAITQGTDQAPLKNYVFLDSADLALKHNINGFPTDRQIVKIAEFVCPTYTKVDSVGSNSFQAFTDHFSNAVGIGHLQEQNTWMRGKSATYLSGMLLQATGGSGVFDISVAVGEIRQLHDHTTPAFDTSGTSVIQVYNDFATPYKVVPNMVDQLTDSLGGSMSGKSANYFFWEIGSENNEDCQLMCSLPSGSYNNSSSAIADSLRYTNKTIPILYTGTAVALAIVTVSHSAGGNTYTIDNIEDLRGTGTDGGGTLGPTPPLADTITISGIVDISAYGVNDRVMTFIRNTVGYFTVWGDGLVAAIRAEIADLSTNTLLAVSSLVVKSTIVDANIGMPLLEDSIVNIGAGSVSPERYQVIGTANEDLDGPYIEDTVTGELFAGYKTWFISGTFKRLRPVAETGAGAVYAYAVIEEETPTQYSVLYKDGSDAYFQASPDPSDIDNGSYAGDGTYIGDNSGVVYFAAQSGNSLCVEGDAVFKGGLQSTTFGSGPVLSDSTGVLSTSSFVWNSTSQTFQLSDITGKWAFIGSLNLSANNRNTGILIGVANEDIVSTTIIGTTSSLLEGSGIGGIEGTIDITIGHVQGSNYWTIQGTAGSPADVWVYDSMHDSGSTDPIFSIVSGVSVNLEITRIL